MRRTMSFLAGGMCGALIGAVAALLFAPTSGSELRARAQDELNSLADEARRAYEDRRVELETRLADLQSPPKPAEEMPISG